MERIRMSYRQVKEKQNEDFRTYSKGNLINVYRKLSSFFTWIAVNLGISPNHITILYTLGCVVGFFFLIKGSYISLIAGMIFFFLFKVLDDTDGEVARIQKSQSVEGVYLDRIGHYVYNLCIGIGLGIGMYRIYNDETYLVLGFFFTFVLIVENSILDLMKSTLREKFIEMSVKKKNISEKKAKGIELMQVVPRKKSFAEMNLFSKIFSIYPFQGLLYNDHFPTLIISLLILLEYWFQHIGFQVMVGSLLVSLLALYILVFTLSKSIWIVGYVREVDKNRHMSKFLNN